MTRKCYVLGVSNFSLFASRCKKCQPLTVYGFSGQLKKWKLPDHTVVEFQCEGCQATRLKRYQHTTRIRSRHRMTDWLRWGMWLLCRLPPRYTRRIGLATFWLERRFPI